PLDGVVFRDLVDGGTVELALAWRRGTDNPLVDTAVGILAAVLRRETVEEKR
ncbi:LysR family transcriptional regulator, partial [Mycobacterium sp. CBMA361]|nr:LysR family transcriptional regulator [Mycolicibacterium sp. CBMA 361]